MRLWQLVIFAVIIGMIGVVIYGAHIAPQPAALVADNTPPTLVSVASSTATTTVSMTGDFVALLDGTDRYDRTFKYMVLKQSGHYYHIDLRSIFGTNYTHIDDRIGVQRGARVILLGTFKDGKGAFVVSAIKSAT